MNVKSRCFKSSGRSPDYSCYLHLRRTRSITHKARVLTVADSKGEAMGASPYWPQILFSKSPFFIIKSIVRCVHLLLHDDGADTGLPPLFKLSG